MSGGRNKNEAAPRGENESPAKWETQRKAIQLRAAGASYREIGLSLGIDHTWARRLVVDGIRENSAGDVSELREQEGARLDRLTRAWWPKALGNPDKRIPPDYKAALVMLRIMDRRSKLFGLDAPIQINRTGDLDRQIEDLIKQIAANDPSSTIT